MIEWDPKRKPRLWYHLFEAFRINEDHLPLSWRWAIVKQQVPVILWYYFRCKWFGHDTYVSENKEKISKVRVTIYCEKCLVIIMQVERERYRFD